MTDPSTARFPFQIGRALDQAVALLLGPKAGRAPRGSIDGTGDGPGNRSAAASDETLRRSGAGSGRARTGRSDLRGPGVGALLVALSLLGATAPAAEAQVVAGAGVTVGGFYDELAPWGRWVDCSWGRCWVPAGVDADWQPYSNGQWIYTEYGWTWVSNDPWGGNPWHYGTWSWIQGLGWSWVPGTLWAPAWVTWRYSESWVGWAPLPPTTVIGAAGYVGRPITVSRAHYVFVPSNRFVGRNAAAVRVSPKKGGELMSETRPVTALPVSAGVVRNTALPVGAIERACGARIEVKSIEVAGTVPRPVSAGTGHLAVVAPAREMRAAVKAQLRKSPPPGPTAQTKDLSAKRDSPPPKDAPSGPGGRSEGDGQ